MRRISENYLLVERASLEVYSSADDIHQSFIDLLFQKMDCQYTSDLH